MKTMFKSVLIIIIFITAALTSCKKDVEPPAPMGKLLTYTNIKSSEFDRIDIVVNGEVAGTLTAPYVIKPICGEVNSASTSSIALPPGVYKVKAIQYKNGENVGQWTEKDRTIVADNCTLVNWVD
jgi:hypothetical protein